MFRFLSRDRRRRRFGFMLEPIEGRALLSSVPAFSAAIGPVVSSTSAIGIIHATKGVEFTANLGTFLTIAPAKNLLALVTWGDGTSSPGKLKPMNVGAMNVVRFEVDGTHTYNVAGNFGIQVLVTKPGPTPTSPVVLVARLRDEAIVARGNVDLTGKISGRYTAAPTSIDVGALYFLNGTGTAGEMGPVAAKGSIHLPGFVTAGRATGTLMLSSISMSPLAGGTVSLKLTGPVQSGMGPVPSVMAYAVTGGTGVFSGATGGGTIGVTLKPDGTFLLTITSIKGVV